MDPLYVFLLFVVGVTVYILHKRSRDPGHLLEVVLALRRRAALERLRGNEVSAAELERIATSIDDGLSSVTARRAPPRETSTQMIRDILRASSGEMLEAAEMYNLNGRRSDCYEALMRLAGRLEKMR